MSRERSRFTPEFKDEAVRLVIEGSRPIVQVARQLGINDGTLGNLVAKFRDEHSVSETPLSLSVSRFVAAALRVGARGAAVEAGQRVENRAAFFARERR